MTSVKTTMHKGNRFYWSVGVYSVNARRKSKRGENISCSYHVLPSSVRYQSRHTLTNRILLLTRDNLSQSFDSHLPKCQWVDPHTTLTYLPDPMYCTQTSFQFQLRQATINKQQENNCQSSHANGNRNANKILLYKSSAATKGLDVSVTLCFITIESLGSLRNEDDNGNENVN